MGQLAGSGHLPGPQLVEDLAGLRVTLVVDLGRLTSGEHLERLAGEPGPERERLVRGQDRVAAEERGVPRNAGRDVAFAGSWALVRQKPQVGDATLDGEIEQLVVR